MKQKTAVLLTALTITAALALFLIYDQAGKPQTGKESGSRNQSGAGTAEPSIDTQAPQELIKWSDLIARENRQISAEEAAELSKFLFGARPEAVDSGTWQHLVNSGLNALRSQIEPPMDLGRQLIQMAEGDTDPVLRLYALQHLSFWLDQEKDQAVRREIINCLSRIAKQDGESSRGTAISILSQRDETRGDTEIKSAAIGLITDQNAKHDVRITSMHTCADQGWTESLSQLHKVAGKKEELAIVRSAAIFSIGKLGGAADLAKLEKIKPSTRLKPALRSAIERLQRRGLL